MASVCVEDLYMRVEFERARARRNGRARARPPSSEAEEVGETWKTAAAAAGVRERARDIFIQCLTRCGPNCRCKLFLMLLLINQV